MWTKKGKKVAVKVTSNLQRPKKKRFFLYLTKFNSVILPSAYKRKISKISNKVNKLGRRHNHLMMKLLGEIFAAIAHLRARISWFLVYCLYHAFVLLPLVTLHFAHSSVYMYLFNLTVR